MKRIIIEMRSSNNNDTNYVNVSVIEIGSNVRTHLLKQNFVMKLKILLLSLYYVRKYMLYYSMSI